MSRQPIIVGIDASPEAVTAARLAMRLAERAGARCQLVHAVREFWFAGVTSAEIAVDVGTFNRAIVDEARGHLSEVLKGKVPAALVKELLIETGAPAGVLNAVAERLGAQLIVLGGKHHSTLDRWLSGSTSLNVARTATIPVLVTAGDRLPVQRILAAVDSSAAAGPTLDVAHHLAKLFQADLRVLSVLEPLPVVTDGTIPAVDASRYYELCRETLQHDLLPRLESFGGTLTIRYGTPVVTILRETNLWRADLVVVGSHGKGWAQRLLLGSATEKLLNDLPTSVLVVPIRATAPAKTEAFAEPAGALLAIG